FIIFIIKICRQTIQRFVNRKTLQQLNFLTKEHLWITLGIFVKIRIILPTVFVALSLVVSNAQNLNINSEENRSYSLSEILAIIYGLVAWLFVVPFQLEDTTDKTQHLNINDTNTTSLPKIHASEDVQIKRRVFNFYEAKASIQYKPAPHFVKHFHSACIIVLIGNASKLLVDIAIIFLMFVLKNIPHWWNLHLMYWLAWGLAHSSQPI
ncbi:hypothetical protein RFI_40075, partial [Reticulomyxa filosa]